MWTLSPQPGAEHTELAFRCQSGRHISPSYGTSGWLLSRQASLSSSMEQGTW